MWSAQAPVHDDARQHLFAGGAHLRDHGHPPGRRTPAAARGPSAALVRAGASSRCLAHGHPTPGPRPATPVLGGHRVQPVRGRSAAPPRDRAGGISVVAMARAAGRPVVATATPATIDHIRHEVDGLLVPAGDATALRDAIVRLDTDEAPLRRMTIATQQASARRRHRLGPCAGRRGTPHTPRGTPTRLRAPVESYSAASSSGTTKSGPSALAISGIVQPA